LEISTTLREYRRNEELVKRLDTAMWKPCTRRK